jgi:elongation factor Ts
MKIDAASVKALREKTDAPIMDCKKALVASGGDIDKAIEILKIQGLSAAKKVAARIAKCSKIFSYVHHGEKLGVMLELSAETDFVTNTSEFKDLGKELCLQIAASQPLYVKEEDIPKEVIEKEREIYREQLKGSGKPEKIWDRIIDGKIKKYCEEVCLLNQPWIRDSKKKVADFVAEKINKVRENITPIRFVIFKAGEGER